MQELAPQGFALLAQTNIFGLNQGKLDVCLRGGMHSFAITAVDSSNTSSVGRPVLLMVDVWMEGQRVANHIGAVLDDPRGKTTLKFVVPSCDDLSSSSNYKVAVSFASIYLSSVKDVNINESNLILCTDQHPALSKVKLCDFAQMNVSTERVKSVFVSLATPCSPPSYFVHAQDKWDSLHVDIIIESSSNSLSTTNSPNTTQLHFVFSNNSSQYSNDTHPLLYDRKTGLWLCNISTWFSSLTPEYIGNVLGHKFQIRVWKSDSALSKIQNVPEIENLLLVSAWDASSDIKEVDALEFVLWFGSKIFFISIFFF